MHNACMTSLQIRELPEPLYDLLSFKAQRHHRSLTQQAIAELEHALQPQSPGLRRLQTLSKLREREPCSIKNFDAQLVQWQRKDRER
jgi:plasmid stability protein